MPKRGSGPPFPKSPGDWIACFRHRVAGEDGYGLSPEEFGRLIGRSGATIRRWEANSKLPEEEEIARLAEVCDLTPLQAAFLSAACTRMLATPGPEPRPFQDCVSQFMTSIRYPAMLLDGLFYVRGWNSYMDALGPGLSRALAEDLHPIALMLRAPPDLLSQPREHLATLRSGVRIFWMSTAVYSHRPEYTEMVERLSGEPYFKELWLELALGRGEAAPADPIAFAQSLGGSSARFRVYSRTVTFPPVYHLNEYHPDDEASCARLEELRRAGPARVFFKRDLHWVRPGAGSSPALRKRSRATVAGGRGRL